MVSKNKKKKSRFLFPLSSILAALFLAGSVILLVYFNFKINQKRLNLTSQIEALEEQIATLEEEKTELEIGISEVTEEGYWEAKVREQGYKREGEQQVVVVPPEGSSLEGEEETGSQSLIGQFLENIKNFLRQ